MDEYKAAKEYRWSSQVAHKKYYTASSRILPGREKVQRFVKVVHLNHDAQTNEKNEEICGETAKLIFSIRRTSYRNPKCFTCDNSDRTDKRANGNINERICFTNTRTVIENQE